MTTLWAVILAVALASAAIKAAGPATVGGRDLPPRAVAVVALLSPALLAALVITQTFGGDGRLVLDERALGVAAAGIALAFRAPVLLAVAIAVVVTVAARTLG